MPGTRMTHKSLSLSAQLLLTLVGLTVVTTVVLTVAAFGFLADRAYLALMRRLLVWRQ